MNCVDCYNNAFDFDTCFGKTSCDDGFPNYEYLKKENDRLKRNLTRRMAQATHDRTICLQHEMVMRDRFDKETHNEIKRRMKAFADRCHASLDPCT